MAGDKELKALGQRRVGRLALGQRGDFHRIIGDERRLNQVRFHIFVEQRCQAVALRRVLLDMHVALVADGAGFLVALPRCPVLAARLLDGIRHRDALPRRFQVDDLPLIGHVGRAEGLDGHELVELLNHLHDFVVIRVRLIRFHGRELRVVGRVHALVAEDSADFVHALEAADNQALQVQLRLNAQEHGQPQRVVERAEWTRGRADFHRVQHGRVHFQIAAAVEEFAHGGDDAAALAERVAHFGVDDAVHIALTVAQVGIHQPVELLRQHLQGLAQQRQGLDVDGRFAGLGAEHRAGHADDVAQIVLLERGIGILAQIVAGDVNLHFALRVQQVRKGRLAHHAAGDHAARQRDRLAFERLEVVGNLLRMVGDVKVGDRIGVLPRVDEALQLLAADNFLLRQRRSMGRYGIISHE